MDRLRTRLKHIESGVDHGVIAAAIRQRGRALSPFYQSKAACTASGSQLRFPDSLSRFGGVAGWGWLAAIVLVSLGCTQVQTTSFHPDQALMPLENFQEEIAKVEQPSNYRDWSPDQAVLAYANFHGDRVKVRNIRNCTYLTENEYVVDFYNRSYNLGDLKSVDFITVPFRGMPVMAHTMLSFGFEGDDYLAVSVEIRKEKGESYAFLNGVMRQYEIMYVVGDERDLIKLRTNYRKDDVYIYRTRATPEQARAMFVDVFRRVNQLKDTPEFYNTFTNNCTTNIVQHVNNLSPALVPYDYRVMLPGLTAELAYELGLLDTSVPFEELKRRSCVSDLALQFADSPDFSAKIRSSTAETPVTQRTELSRESSY
ncbi:MAG: DUF4105 domain-containing protein [Pirellulales bacterium]|nr:DUF4105 domain-containing protein [Pirellulales bacterium]